MSLRDILTLTDMEKAAESVLPRSTLNYIQGGATYETTMNDNISALSKYKIRPKVLRDVSCRNTTTTILGNKVAFPVGISPSALQKLAHKDGEIATAKAASSLPTVMTVSMASCESTHNIMKANPSLICFQQIYITNPRSLTEKFVRVAEANNVKALVVSVDHPVLPLKFRNWKLQSEFEARISNYARYNDDLYEAIQENGKGISSVLFPGNITWNDIAWLKSITHLPIIAKGIISAESAREALIYGINAIWVSNQGGRTLDSLPATIDMLTEIVQEVNGRCEIFVDGGFRTGLDVFKALAMGAQAVFIGRPVQYGLAVAGADGVKHVLDILKREFDNTMALAGCKSVNDIVSNFIFMPNKGICCKL